MDSEMDDNNVSVHSDNEVGQVPPSDAPKKKRGPSQGPAILPEGQMRYISTNEWGIPNEMDEDTKALKSHIGLNVRDTLPVAYEKFDMLPAKPVNDVMMALKKTYDLNYVNASWLDQKIRKSWRDKKFNLRRKYILGKVAGEVKAKKTPPFVTTEDWHKFIDLSTTTKFDVMSKRNASNRSKLEMPYAAGRHSTAQICHKIAKEKNLASDSEVGRAEVYIATHTKKDNTEQCPEKMNEMRLKMRDNPETRLTGVNDALAQTMGKDTRGRTRGIAPGISARFLKDSAHMVSKIVDSEKQNTKNGLEMTSLKRRVDELTELVSTFVDTQRQKTRNVASPRSTISNTPTSQHQHQYTSDIGKKCEIYGWGNVLVAYGIVAAVDPHAIVHNVVMGDGNYKVLIESAVDHEAPLFKPNSQVTVIDEVVGSYAVWPKVFLKFVD